jgi:hypothetical protein
VWRASYVSVDSIVSEIDLEKVLGPPHAKLVSSSKIQAHEAWVFFLDRGELELCRMVLLTAIGPPEEKISLSPYRVVVVVRLFVVCCFVILTKVRPKLYSRCIPDSVGSCGFRYSEHGNLVKFQCHSNAGAPGFS